MPATSLYPSGFFGRHGRVGTVVGGLIDEGGHRGQQQPSTLPEAHVPTSVFYENMTVA